jgi:hypothetical protein
LQAEAQPAARDDTQPAAPIERVAPSGDQESPPVAGNVFTAPIPFERSQKARAYLASHPGATMWTEDYTMPCVDYPIADLRAIDPVTGKEEVVDSMFDTSMPYPAFAGYPRLGGPYSMRSPYLFAGYGGMFDSPWNWAVCHAGGWIRWHHRYAWVAGTKRHHKPPVRWVKSGRQVGFVPLHPKDVAGKPPINLKDGIILPAKKGDAITVKRDNLKEGKPVELLTEAPKEFRKPALEPLKIAETPQAEAYSAYSSSVAAKGSTTVKSSERPMQLSTGIAKSVTATGGAFAMKEKGTPITFDHKTQSFVVTRPVMENGRPGTVVEPLGGRVGSVQAGSNGATTMRTPSYNGTQSYNGAQSRPATNTGSISNAGSSVRTYTPAPSNSAPAQSYSAPARSYSPPPAPAYTPPPAPAYSPPPAPSYSPPPAPASSGGSTRR